MYSFCIGMSLLFIAYGTYSVISDATSGFNPNQKDFGAIVLGTVFLILDLWKFGRKSFFRKIATGGFFVGVMFFFGGILHLVSGVTKWGRTVEPSEAGLNILSGIILMGVFGFLKLFADQIEKNNEKSSNNKRIDAHD